MSLKNWFNLKVYYFYKADEYFKLLYMKIGYARVSTTDQTLNLQLDALQKAGCEKTFQEKKSGTVSERPELDKMLEQLRPGDVVYIYKLDRLGRSIKHLLSLIELFKQKEVGLVSLTDSIDTTTPQGRLVFSIFAALAEFEAELIRERTKAGLEAAKKRGRRGGRPQGLTKKAQQTAIIAEALYKEGNLSVQQMLNELKISRATLYKYLRARGVIIS